MAPPFRRIDAGLPLHQTVQVEIRSYILKNGLRPGDPLKPEAELARIFGVSRNSVREAVKALESTGVLETRRGSGVFIRDFSFAPLLDHLPYALMQDRRALSELLALRKTLEAGLIADALKAMTDESVNAMRDTLTAIRELAEQDQDFPDHDREFHRLMFVDLGNEMLLAVFDLFWQAFHRAVPPHWARPPKTVYQAHAKIFDAIVSADADQARSAIIEHYAGVESRVARLEESG